MALDERYIVASDIEQYYVDKDSGLPLANGTLTFYRDNARNVPKAVFQLSGSPPAYNYTSMGAQITLSSVGTVQNSGGDNEVIYYYPWIVNASGELELDLYYIVCRDENGIEQFTREAWPNITTANDPTRDETSLQNQISNPTFTNVFINEGQTTTYTVSAATDQEFAFAPDWVFVISGTGTVVISRVAISGNDNVVTSPPYVLDISTSSGITKCYLRQRFFYNSGLWASTPNHPLFLAGSYVARNESAGTAGIQMLYQESSGGSPIVIVDGSFTTSYALITGATADPIPASTNTDTGKDGYIDIILAFSSLNHVRVTSVQVLPTASDSVNIVPYDTNSSNREEALQGDYFIPRLVQKNISSFLTGWDFPLNPYQLAASGSITTTAAYITDQTIALCGSTGNVAWAKNAVTNGIQFTPAGTDDAFYILQYLSGAEAKKILGTPLAANIFAYQGSVGDAVTMRVYLYRGSAAAIFPVLPVSIGTLSADGTFVLSAVNWTLIPRGGLDTAEVTIEKLLTNDEINSGNYDYGFSQWEITDAAQIADTDKFAIVVTFQYADASSVITVNSISVVPGDLPCRPEIKTFSETLQDCQYYYEKSYNPETYPGVATNGAVFKLQEAQGNGTIVQTFPTGFELPFKTIKRTNAYNLAFLSPTSGTADRVRAYVNSSSANVSSIDITFSTSYGNAALAADNGKFGTHFFPIGGAALVAFPDPSTSPNGYILFHYLCDARLGVV